MEISGTNKDRIIQLIENKGVLYGLSEEGKTYQLTKEEVGYRRYERKWVLCAESPIISQS